MMNELADGLSREANICAVRVILEEITPGEEQWDKDTINRAEGVKWVDQFLKYRQVKLLWPLFKHDVLVNCIHKHSNWDI